MRTLVLQFALYCTFITPASAELRAHLTLARTQDIQVLVVCSQSAEFNADRLRGFVVNATGISPNFIVVDGPHEFRRPDSGEDAAPKALIVFSDGVPDQSLKDCISATVPFGEAAFDSITETQAALGREPPVPDPHKYGPVVSTTKTIPIPRSEWVLYVFASALSNDASVNEAMMSLFRLYPDGCSDNTFCLPRQK